MAGLGGRLARFGPQVCLLGSCLRFRRHQRRGAAAIAFSARSGEIRRWARSRRQVPRGHGVLLVADPDLRRHAGALKQIVTDFQIEPEGAPFGMAPPSAPTRCTPTCRRPVPRRAAPLPATCARVCSAVWARSPQAQPTPARAQWTVWRANRAGTAPLPAPRCCAEDARPFLAWHHAQHASLGFIGQEPKGTVGALTHVADARAEV